MLTAESSTCHGKQEMGNEKEETVMEGIYRQEVCPVTNNLEGSFPTAFSGK